MFFSNDFDKAETLFKSKSNQDPLYALGVGCILLIKALMTFNESDIGIATKALERAEAIANIQVSRYSDPLSLASAAQSGNQFFYSYFKDTHYWC